MRSLRRAVLAAALLVPVIPAHAGPVTLSCQSPAAGSATWVFRIDYSTGRIEQLGSDGNPFKGTTAKVSPNAISWSAELPASYKSADGASHATTEHWEGYLSRLTGTGSVTDFYVDLYPNPPIQITCEQASQKF